MKVKYLGKQKKKIYRSTERFGETYYKLIFEKLNENELESGERDENRHLRFHWQHKPWKMKLDWK